MEEMLKKALETSDVALWVKAPAAKPNDLSLVTGPTCCMERGSYKLLSTSTPLCARAHKHINEI